MSKKITHIGKIVKKVDKDKYIVEVNPTSACSSCSQGSFCHAFGGDTNKRFVVESNKEFDVNSQVVVSITQKSLFLSIFMAYILPILLLLVAALVTNFVFKKDLVTAIVSLVVLFLYFIGLKKCKRESVKINVESYL